LECRGRHDGIEDDGKDKSGARLDDRHLRRVKQLKIQEAANNNISTALHFSSIDISAINKNEYWHIFQRLEVLYLLMWVEDFIEA
jgi:hypothetical protein